MDSESSYVMCTTLLLDLDSARWKMLMESTMNLGEPFAFDFYQFNDNITQCIPYLIISYLEEKLKIPWLGISSNEIKCK